ncbi:MAG: hypothetical protein HC853_14655 [Anaerolineae bacterium]|nr:hypothetical protein [Anaerolineae bacterium]
MTPQTQYTAQLAQDRLRLMVEYEDAVIRPRQMATHLTWWSRGGVIGNTFRAFFPSEWHASTATVAAGSFDRGMSAREWQFFSLVDGRFPCVSYSNYFMGVDERPSSFLIKLHLHEPHAPEWLDEGTLPELVIEYLLGMPPDDSLSGLYDHIQMRLPAASLLGLPGCWLEFDYAKFRKCCIAQSKACRNWLDLATLFEVIGGRTGNCFLDPSPNEEPVGRHMHEWGISYAAIETLALDWKRAQRLLRQKKRAEAWLLTQPDVWPDVFALWEACQT